MAGRVLSVQSHVAHGYVGNRAAVFPLQLLGHEVDFVNTVSFASMYLHAGARAPATELEPLLRALPAAYAGRAANSRPGPVERWEKVDSFSAVPVRFLLTGYMGTVDALAQVVKFFEKITRPAPAKIGGAAALPPLWVCDPVLGDNGHLYVSPDLVQIYKDEVLPLVFLLTPNQFELGWLTDRSIASLEDAKAACVELHSRGPRYVVVTSVDFGDKLVLLGSSKKESVDSKTALISQFTITFPKRQCYLGGTGDLMAAMLLRAIDKNGGDLARACQEALSVVQSVIDKTLRLNPDAWDVQVVACADVIVNPSQPAGSFVVDWLD